MGPPLEDLAGGELIRVIPNSEDQGKRIDAFLSEKLEDLSRTRIQELIKLGHVAAVDGAVRRPNLKVQSGGWIDVRLPPPLASTISAEEIPLDILFEDEDIAVVIKPSGLPTHPTRSKTTGTLVNALQHHLKNLSGVGGVLRPGIVHRLDRVTSGILVIAKNDAAHQSLTTQFKNRTVEKTYRALCLGTPPDRQGIIEGLIDRHPTRRQRMVLGGKSGRDSKTEYEVIAVNDSINGMLLRPHTGRTHQIRVHLEKIRCPIVLDRLYGFEPKRWPFPKINSLIKEYPGIFLHAERLELTHPKTEKRINFRVDPPENFMKVWRGVFGD